MPDITVVPNRTPLTEDDFRANWVVTLARLCRDHGDAKVALWLGVSGAQGGALVIRTSYGMRRLPAERADTGDVLARLATSDPLLEQMAFSRGRFLVTVEGGPSLVVPAWPEFARVIEDCRGR